MSYLLKLKLNLSKEFIKSKVNPEKLRRIKEQDPEPYLNGYLFIREGTSHPHTTLDPAGQVIDIRSFFREQNVHEAVEIVNKKIEKKPIKVFYGHNSDNAMLWDFDDAMDVGEVIGAYTDKKDGFVGGYAIVYFYQKGADLDEVSIEMATELEDSTSDIKAVKKVVDVTGLAVLPDGSGAIKGAKRVFKIAAQKKEENMNPMNLSQEELRDIIRSRQFKASDLFSESELWGRKINMADGTQLIQGGDDKLIQMKEDLANRIVGNEKKTLEDKVQELEGELKPLRESKHKLDIIDKKKEIMGEYAEQAKENKQFQSYLETKLDSFNPDFGRDVKKDGDDLKKNIETDFEYIKKTYSQPRGNDTVEAGEYEGGEEEW